MHDREAQTQTGSDTDVSDKLSCVSTPASTVEAAIALAYGDGISITSQQLSCALEFTTRQERQPPPRHSCPSLLISSNHCGIALAALELDPRPAASALPAAAPYPMQLGRTRQRHRRLEQWLPGCGGTRPAADRCCTAASPALLPSHRSSRLPASASFDTRPAPCSSSHLQPWLRLFGSAEAGSKSPPARRRAPNRRCGGESRRVLKAESRPGSPSPPLSLCSDQSEREENLPGCGSTRHDRHELHPAPLNRCSHRHPVLGRASRGKGKGSAT